MRFYYKAQKKKRRKYSREGNINQEFGVWKLTTIVEKDWFYFTEKKNLVFSEVSEDIIL